MPPSDALPAFGMTAFALSYGLIAISPGPNFLVVAQAGVSGSPRDVFCTAGGVAVGAGLLTALSCLLFAGLDEHPMVRSGLTLAFATLLLAIGCRSLLCAARARDPDAGCNPKPKARFWAGFFTALFNPATMAFVGASMSGQMHDGPDTVMRAMIVFAIAGVWFCLAGSCITLPFAQGVYRRYARPITAATGVLLIGLSVSTYGAAIRF